MTPTERIKRLIHEMDATVSPSLRLRLAARVAHAGADLLEEAGNDLAETAEAQVLNGAAAQVDLTDVFIATMEARTSAILDRRFGISTTLEAVALDEYTCPETGEAHRTERMAKTCIDCGADA